MLLQFAKNRLRFSEPKVNFSSGLARGLIGLWYPSATQAGSNVLRDYSIYQNHGSLNGMVASTDWVGNHNGWSLSYTTNKRVIVTTASPIDTADQGPMSISLWYWTNALSGTSILFGKQFFSAGCWSIYRSGGTLIFIHDGSTDMSVTYGISGVSVWHHLVLVWDGTALTSGVQCYIDGVLTTPTASTNGASLVYSTVINLAISNISASYPWLGQVGSVAMWSRQLTPAEAWGLYNQRYNMGGLLKFKNITLGLPPPVWLLMNNNFKMFLQVDTPQTVVTPDETEKKITLYSHGF